MDDATSDLSDAGPSERLAGWVETFDFDAVPASAKAAATDCLIDMIACMVGGVGLAASRVALDVFLAAGSGDRATVPGSRRRLGVLDAAWLGGHTANALDFDDCFRDGAPSHPGATIIPPALALAEARGCRGRDLLKAIVAGYEVSLRIGRAIDASPARKAEVMGYGTWQTFGATVAGASLLGLRAREIRSAFGIAAMQAPVPGVRKAVEGVRPYGWIKNAYGAAAQQGLLAALLAAEGFHGHQSVLEGPFGFWIMSGSDRHDPSGYRDLGEDWMIERVEFKPYACCRWSHTTIEALETLGRDLRPDDVARVDVHGFGEFHVALGGALPETIVDAQFNAPWLAALQLVGRSPARGLDEADLADPSIRAVAERVHLHHEPAFDPLHAATMATPVRVELTTTDGATRAIYLEEPPTSITRGGFDREAICGKFLAVCAPVLGETRAAACLDLLLDVEASDVTRLAELLTPAVSPARPRPQKGASR